MGGRGERRPGMDVEGLGPGLGINAGLDEGLGGHPARQRPSQHLAALVERRVDQGEQELGRDVDHRLGPSLDEHQA